jgi:hypothetical protein
MTRISPFVAALSVACIVAVAASSATPPPMTQRSTGKTFRLAKGDTMKLRLSNRWRWSGPTVSTEAVELTPVAYLIDPGFQEWTIDARKRGRATIRSLGKPNCSTCALATRTFRVTVVVGAAG